jgi:hypothetical protein
VRPGSAAIGVGKVSTVFRLLDERGQILRSVIIIGLVIALIIFVLVEAGPIIWFRISTMNDAGDVAETAAGEYVRNGEEGALASAGEQMQLMGYSEEEIRESSVVFLPEGGGQKETVRVTVVKYASTLLTRRINQLKRYSRVATTREAKIRVR